MPSSSIAGVFGVPGHSLGLAIGTRRRNWPGTEMVLKNQSWETTKSRLQPTQRLQPVS